MTKRQAFKLVFHGEGDAAMERARRSWRVRWHTVDQANRVYLRVLKRRRRAEGDRP